MRRFGPLPDFPEAPLFLRMPETAFPIQRAFRANVNYTAEVDHCSFFQRLMPDVVILERFRFAPTLHVAKLATFLVGGILYRRHSANLATSNRSRY